jgi:hypothetical protein
MNQNPAVGHGTARAQYSTHNIQKMADKNRLMG